MDPALARSPLAPRDHVPGHPFPTDPGSWIPKASTGRNWAEFNAPCGKPEGAVLGFCGLLSGAFLSRITAQLSQFAVSDRQWLGQTTADSNMRKVSCWNQGSAGRAAQSCKIFHFRIDYVIK